MKIAFIGAGNVAEHLALALQAKGHLITEVYSRKLENAKALASKLSNTLIISNLDFYKSEADLFIISVSDDAIGEVSKQLIIPNQRIIVHTSGSKPMESIDLQVFTKSNQSYNQGVKKGVFYPLQTFSKSKSIDFQSVPFCIEADNEKTAQILFQLAQDLSDLVYLIDAPQRKILHVAAVFACNFTNHLLTLAQEILNDRQLNFALLKPLIQETFAKALSTNPLTAQTGPARRGDLEVLAQHQVFLADEPEKQKIYQILSESILAHYKTTKH